MTDNYSPAYDKLVQLEGGYKLINIPGDAGGLTYCGITKRAHPDWPGWKIIETEGPDSPKLPPLVKDFYKHKYWELCGAELFLDEECAGLVFHYAVVAGIKKCVRVMQVCLGIASDGIIGSHTERMIKQVAIQDSPLFEAQFRLGQIAHYAHICMKNQTQRKFLLGWVNRALS